MHKRKRKNNKHFSRLRLKFYQDILSLSLLFAIYRYISRSIYNYGFTRLIILFVINFNSTVERTCFFQLLVELEISKNVSLPLAESQVRQKLTIDKLRLRKWIGIRMNCLCSSKKLETDKRRSGENGSR